MVFHISHHTWLRRSCKLQLAIMNPTMMLADSVKKLLRVALIGAPNAGKSTLLNRLIENEVSCVSNKVHTTKRNILGVYTEDDTQLEFYDSPGVVTKTHLVKHRLDPTMVTEPVDASTRCNLIAVVVDAANIREQRKLNKGVLDILHSNEDKDSILILNKVDLVRDKQSLIDIGTRLTQGYLERRQTISRGVLRKMSSQEIEKLNLTSHINSRRHQRKQVESTAKLHRFVIDLEPDRRQNQSNTADTGGIDPDNIGYKNFSQLFSISALHDDGVDDLREYLLDSARPVEDLPHTPNYVSSLSVKEVVHEIIRGKVMDNVDQALPYVLGYNYQEFRYDELGSLHIRLRLVCPKKYMIGRVVGEAGVVIYKITQQAHETICKTLGCDTKLIIEVDSRRQ